MRSNITNIIQATLIFISLSCSTSEKVDNKLSVDVVQTTVDAWFDLMPGISPGKFHLSGEIKISNSNSVDVENLNLTTIKVYSNSIVIYTIKPYFSPRLKEDDYSIKLGKKKIFNFGTETGLKIDSRLEESNVIDVNLNFTIGKDNFIYEIKDIVIKRVY